MKMDLVTVTVSSYNSSSTVLETLDSILNQSWKNIELIIKDDASTDDSLEKCKNWVEKNGSRFSRIDILTTDKRLGIPANFNRGIKAANGSWIKPIAGDDALMPDCIKDNMEYIYHHPEVKVLFSINKIYKNDFSEDNFLYLKPSKPPRNIITNQISAAEQYEKLLLGDKIPFTPSIFLNKEALLNAGLPDEDLFSEDYQTKLKLTKAGYKLHFMDKVTVLYRKHDKATNNTNTEYILKPHYFKTESFRSRYIYPNIPFELRMSQKYSWVMNRIFKIRIFNKVNKFNRSLYFFINVFLNPFRYVIYFKTHFLNNNSDNLTFKK